MIEHDLNDSLDDLLRKPRPRLFAYCRSLGGEVKGPFFRRS
jgi:hypothetical protein